MSFNDKRYIKFSNLKVGQKFTTNSSKICVVEDFKDNKNITIRFLDTGNTKVVQLGSLNRGEVKDLIYNVGYISGRYPTKNGLKIEKAYDVWRRMLCRCTEDWAKTHSTYQGAAVCQEWHNYDNFCDWFYKQYYQRGYELDKDLVGFNRRFYSPETCCLIPSHINKVISGTRFLGYSKAPSKGRNKYELTYRGKHIGMFETLTDSQNAYISVKTEYVRSLSNTPNLPIKAKGALLNYTLEIVGEYVERKT